MPESRTNRHGQLQRYAFSDRRDSGLHPLVCGLPAELPSLGGDDARARRVGRPLIDQPVGDSFPAAHREDGPETQAPGRRQLADGRDVHQGQGRLEIPLPRRRQAG